MVSAASFRTPARRRPQIPLRTYVHRISRTRQGAGGSKNIFRGIVVLSCGRKTGLQACHFLPERTGTFITPILTQSDQDSPSTFNPFIQQACYCRRALEDVENRSSTSTVTSRTSHMTPASSSRTSAGSVRAVITSSPALWSGSLVV